MSGKLDQSLDQIMKDNPSGRGRGRAGKRGPPRRAATKAKAAIAAPAGGIQKNTKANSKPVKAAAAIAAAPITGDSKIIVSNLPEDVTETQIKDYFSQTIGRVRKALVTYGPTGRSRGRAEIIFTNPTSAAQAARQLDGVQVDGRPMKIEIILGAKQAPEPTAPKSLSDRMSQPKSAAKQKQKPAPKTNGVAAADGAAKGKAGRKAKPARAGRPKKKTVEELDSEMVDYYNANPATNGTAQPADTGMVDDIA